MDAKALQKARREAYLADKYKDITFEWRPQHLPIVVLAVGSLSAVALVKILRKKRRK